MRAEEPVQILPTTPADASWIESFVEKAWGAPFVVVHDTVYHPHALPGFKALSGGRSVGLLTYDISGEGCEIVTLNSLQERRGIGTALLRAVRSRALERGCARVWLVTTNDNLGALGFYQKCGFLLVSIDRGAVERARKLKPGIPLVGEHRIPIRDEITLELRL